MSFEFKEGMIGLSGGKSFMQRMIRFFTRSKFSHSFVVIKGPDSFLYALETSSTVVTFTPVNRKFYEKNYIEVWETNSSILKEAIVYKSLENLFDKSGEWYGYLSYIWYIYRFFCEKLILGYNPAREYMWNWCRKGVTCTELTASSLFSYMTWADLNTITPQDLKNFLESNKEKYGFKIVGYIRKDLMGD